MLIHVTAGAAEGPTPLAAFDRALHRAGIANFNLVALSSVIPPGATLVRGIPSVPIGGWGDRLYIVLAEKREVIPGREAAAGLGWMQEPARGNGLFVEHNGSSTDDVEVQIKDSLHAMREYRPDVFGEVEHEMTSIVCESRPVCALVAAIYRAQSWDT